MSMEAKSSSRATAPKPRLMLVGAQVDNTAEKIGPKKHAARRQKIPYILVVGEQEAAAGTVNVNDRSGRSLGNEPLDAFIARCRREVDTRAIEVGKPE